MARIIAGKAGSLALETPATHTRPTSDRVREALFSALESRGVISGARVLDLFAGSGALGLEALSRGARELTAVESQASVCQVLRRNVTKVCAALDNPPVHVHARRVASFLASADADAFDLVFIDPPYDTSNDDVEDTLRSLARHLDRDAVVVVERSRRDSDPQWPEGYQVLAERNYGDTRVVTVGLSR